MERELDKSSDGNLTKMNHFDLLTWLTFWNEFGNLKEEIKTINRKWQNILMLEMHFWSNILLH